MRKRFYILFVARDAEGQLRKIPIPLHYVQVFLAGALIGMLSITGMAGSYGRMLMKTMRFNQVRAEKEQLKTRYNRLEKVAQEKDIQVASLGSLASEVTALYGLKSQSLLATSRHDAPMPDEQVKKSLDQFWMLRTSALNGGAAIGISMMGRRNFTAADWLRLSEEPNLWPVEGRVTGSFGNVTRFARGIGAASVAKFARAFQWLTRLLYVPFPLNCLRNRAAEYSANDSSSHCSSKLGILTT